LRFLFFSLLVATSAAASAQTWAWDDGTTPFVVSPDQVVDRMLYFAQPKPGEKLIDLGSGDGRIVIEAARRFGARGLGVDIDKHLVELARENARRAGVEKLVDFEVQDLFDTDLRGASVVTMYLLPEVNQKLIPRLLGQLKPGARVVSHDYDMGKWTYDEMIEITLAEKMVGPLGRSRIFLWIVPGDARGRWVSEVAEQGGQWNFNIDQQYQLIDVEAQAGAARQTVRGARLRGEEIHIAVTGLVGGKAWNHMFRGTIRGGAIEGEVRVSDGQNERILPWKASRQP